MYYLVNVDDDGMAVDRTNGGMLWNGSEEDGNVRHECEQDEGTDCADGHSDTNW
jgi:hypothetical protein